ncbi:uncharacterized protein M6B38_276300 [Iris pallida]|uniref:GPI inositol-deacylase n=1 Tax=Iris pallida TaxID=29817 RepID=A0AAX6I307_IRIPA|nr:uncharacterized protein M6B38_276300 [Iris pallida]
MRGLGAKLRVGALLLLLAAVGLAALYGLLRPVSSGCVMTYMYPTYIPISAPPNVSSDRYGLFLYHEGWKKIDFEEHIKNLNGVPVLFVPGNGGSYKQVRSLAAESSRAYQAGPLEPTFYREASLLSVEEGINLSENQDDFEHPIQYIHMLDWFAVDLEGEHSAMDGQILEEHAEYVVYAIHRILDLYQDSREARLMKGIEVTGSLPASVILVGHSMGGFVARAAVVHPHLRKLAVETILTLSTPHQSPPVALQPSLGNYFSRINGEWRKGYEMQITHAGHIFSNPALSRVIVISVSGGVNDFQVRSKLASLDGVVPSTHGFMISSSGMKNVWLSMDHQSILWCNQLVVQISHTLLSLVNPETGYPFPSTRKRLVVFTKMLQSGIPQSLNLRTHIQPSLGSNVVSKVASGASGSHMQGLSRCPPSIHWTNDGLEKDLYIKSASVTVLAMDGKRRWLDIKKLGSNGNTHFIFVTNLAPCSGVRLHLWPERGNLSSESEAPAGERILEVTSNMVRIPAGPAPMQIEPGSQTEQAPPSALLLLSPKEMHGFRFLTIAVAPSPTISGRPPPATSMAVGQFFNPDEGQRQLSSWLLLHSSYAHEEMFLKEDHPLALNLSFSVSLGILPVTLSLRTAGCGIKSSALPDEQSEHVDHSSLCRLRCFPPVAIAWDSVSGLHIIPNLYTETVTVDSSPAIWDSSEGSDKTTMLLLVDPHCSYEISVAVSLIAAASRFFLLYSSKIIGFMVAVVFFALRQQARAWELDLPLPSVLTAVEFNLRLPLPFFLLALLPIIASLALSFLTAHPIPPVASFLSVSIACFLIANGSVIVLILSSQLVLCTAAILHVFIRKRWLALEGNFFIMILHQILDFSSIFYSLKVVQILRANPRLVVAFITMPLVCFVHPALGLVVLLLFHAYNCHTALCSFLAASFRSHAQRNESFDSRTKGNSSFPYKSRDTVAFEPLLPLDESNSGSPNSTKGFGESQLEIFNYQHGVLMLHLLATLMFLPSLVAWLQRIAMGQSFPWFIDSALSVGVILHGLCGPGPNTNALSIFSYSGWDVGVSMVYLLSGYYSFLSALALAPYKSFYAMAAIGVLSSAFRIMDRRNREKGDGQFRNKRRHSHKH